MKKKLFAGPWVGEFGWELFAWQAHIRVLAKKYDKVVICSRPGHQLLYEDFADDYIENEAPYARASMWDNKDKVPFIYADRIDESYDWINPVSYWQAYHRKHGFTGCKLNPSEFVLLGKKREELAYDLVIHPRNRSKISPNPWTNWPKQNWESLVSHFSGFRIATVGTKVEAHYIEGTEDKRNIPLKDLADLYASSNLIVGPSSGAMHFAALCGTPHFVWGQFDKNKARFEIEWNPFRTPVKVILPEKGSAFIDRRRWQPPVKWIIREIENAPTKKTLALN